MARTGEAVGRKVRGTRSPSTAPTWAPRWAARRGSFDMDTGVTSVAPEPTASRTMTLTETDDNAKGVHIGWYIVFLSPCSLLLSCVTIGLWSSMGMGQVALDALQTHDWLWYPCTSMWVAILALLVTLDFFRPPHLPGQYMCLWDGDVFVGRGVLFVAGVCFWGSLLFMAGAYPSVPLVTTIMLGPLFMVVIRWRLAKQVDPEDMATVQSFSKRLRMFRELVRLEADAGRFYIAATIAFLLASVAALVAWLVWLQGEGHDLAELSNRECVDGWLAPLECVPIFSYQGSTFTHCTRAGDAEIPWCSHSAEFSGVWSNCQACEEGVLSSSAKDELYILWSAPLVVVVSNCVFAMFAAARVFFHNSYTNTADFIMEDRVSMESTKSARERAERHQRSALRQLANLVKLVVCAFIFVITLFWITGQLLYADSQVAQMALGLLGAFFCTFVAFIVVSLRRVALHLWDWVARLPVWRTAQSIAHSDWTRAFGLSIALPCLPVVCVSSLACQCVRKCRGLYDSMEQPAMPEESDSGESCTGVTAEPLARKPPAVSKVTPRQPSDDAQPPVAAIDPRTLWLTPRVHAVFEQLRRADRLSLLGKCYVLCALMFAYTVFPIGLNVFLAWFNKVLLEMGLSFPLIVGITFGTGVLAFLLPPVPGLTVYVFGGLMMSSTCPYGFWAGAFINIGLGWALKLFACAIQQKIIGGLLGQSLWVRRTCGVHKVTIRCIEAEMRRPGWTIGKLAILCGGPDWPVSVLAGILNLSLVQCELGTLPIIFFIIPCSLSGSFYMMRGTSEVWTRSGNLMLAASVLISGVLWVIAGWAIQNQLENNYTELTRPLPQNVDLEWLDHRDKMLKKAAEIRWETMPRGVRWLYAFCAMTQILVCHLFYFGFELLFNSFEVSDNIDELLSWYGEDGIVLTGGLAALVVFCAAWFGPVTFSIWSRASTRGARRAAAKTLDKDEARWKEAWKTWAENWTPPEEGRKGCEQTSGAPAMLMQRSPEDVPSPPLLMSGAKSVSRRQCTPILVEELPPDRSDHALPLQQCDEQPRRVDVPAVGSADGESCEAGRGAEDGVDGMPLFVFADKNADV